MFLADVRDADMPIDLKDDSIKALFYLLYSRHGNDPIANYDECQFKYKVFTTIFTFGGEWEKRLEIQKKLRDLDLDSGDLFDGTKAIVNQASNPSVAPSTGETDELGFVNAQNVNKIKRGKVDAYAMLWTMLNSDVTNEFLARFDNCFLKFVKPATTAIYINEDEEDI